MALFLQRIAKSAFSSAGSVAPAAALAGRRFYADIAAEISSLNEKIAGQEPVDVMKQALEKYGNDIAISFSGAEDVVLVELAKETGLPFRVFSLDTGRLHPQTYKLFDKVENHYGIRIEYCCPQHEPLQELVRTKGMFSFYKDGHKECCGVRKVEPLRRQLSGLRAWITGQRHDQSPNTRADVKTVEVDPVFTGLGGAELIKFNPLANTSSSQVWNLIRTKGVPYNEIHEQGFISIGCEPCTRPVLPGMHEREGRWWWEEATMKECGLHSGNVAK